MGLLKNRFLGTSHGVLKLKVHFAGPTTYLQCLSEESLCGFTDKIVPSHAAKNFFANAVKNNQSLFKGGLK